MSADLMAFLNARYYEAETLALEASRNDEGPLVPGGEHWQWVCNDDEVVTPDPLTQEFMECSHESVTLSLQSVEEYETEFVGPLPHFVLPTVEEVAPVVGQYLLAHDPAHVLADIAAKRAIVGEYARLMAYADESGMPGPDELDGLDIAVRHLASVYADHPDYREEWKP